MTANEISNRRSSDVSQTTRSSEEDEKTVNCTEKVDPIEYPAVLESAPFPVLGSLEEITQTLSRVKSNQTHKSGLDDKQGIISQLEDGKNELPFKQTEYEHGDGFKNPGWLTVLGSFLVNFYVFGNTFCWGVYQSLYINTVFVGQTDLMKIAFVGTSASALLLALGMFITPVIQKIGFRGTMVIGTILSPLSLILASFSTQLWHVYLSQGILFGIGSAFAFSPSVTLPSQWFTSRRALATGIAVSGSGVGGVCLSPMIQKLITTIGYRNTLRVQGAFGFGLLCIATALATSRYRPPPSANGRNKWYHIYDSSLISRKFLLLLGFSFFVPFAYVAPFFLTPQWVAYIGLDASTGAAMISVMSAANAICRITLGYLADRTGRFNTMFVCTFLAGLFTMVIWQFAYEYATFVAFCVLYGLTAGGFVSLLPVTCADIVGVENIQKGLGMAYMTTVIGNLLGTPIIGLLKDTFGWTAAIQFAGAMSMVSASFMLVLRMLMAKGKFLAKV